MIPRELEEGVIYVSIKYATAIYNCCCGCGNRVVTPRSPVQWKLILDGSTVSLDPSMGNGRFPCRSPYWITNNRLEWSYQFSADEIDRVSTRDERVAAGNFGPAANTETEPPQPTGKKPPKEKSKRNLVHKIVSWFGPKAR